MRYNSIGEYFYRLSNRCLALVILPVLMVWAAYAASQYFFSGLPWMELDDASLIRWVATGGMCLLSVFGLQWSMLRGRLKALTQEHSLGERMRLYISV